MRLKRARALSLSDEEGARKKAHYMHSYNSSQPSLGGSKSASRPTPTSPKPTLCSLPVEIQTLIFCHLDGDPRNFRNLALVSSKFRALLVCDEYRIAFTIAKRSRGIMQILLGDTAETRPSRLFKAVDPYPPALHSYKWLGAAYVRSRKIEALVDRFENLGAFDDAELFCAPVEKSDITNAKRLLYTVFLAAELCACRNSWFSKSHWITEAAPKFAVDFAYLSYQAIIFLISQAYQFIREEDAQMSGFGEVSFFWRAQEMNRDLVEMLGEGMLLAGPSALAELLELRQYKDMKEFEEAARTRLYGCHANYYPMPADDTLLIMAEDVTSVNEENMDHKGEEDVLGAFDLDLSKWKKSIKNDEDWENFMRKNKWSRPFRLINKSEGIY